MDVYGSAACNGINYSQRILHCSHSVFTGILSEHADSWDSRSLESQYTDYQPYCRPINAFDSDIDNMGDIRLCYAGNMIELEKHSEHSKIFETFLPFFSRNVSSLTSRIADSNPGAATEIINPERI